jgi:hypothetical protein
MARGLAALQAFEWLVTPGHELSMAQGFFMPVIPAAQMLNFRKLHRPKVALATPLTQYFWKSITAKGGV